MGYTKLDENLVTSSVWSEDDKTLRVWVYLMTRAGANGAVLDTIPAIARACGYDAETVESALAKFAAPDKYSRSPELEGRRIVILHEPEFAIHLVNHKKYRGKAHTAAERKQAQRVRERDVTLGHAASRDVTTSPPQSRKQKQKQKQKQTETEARKATAGAAAPRPKSKWVSEACDDWNERYGPGSADGGRIAGGLGRVVKARAKSVGATELETWAGTVRPAWRRYLAETTHPSPSAQDFASHSADWIVASGPRRIAHPPEDPPEIDDAERARQVDERAKRMAS